MNTNEKLAELRDLQSRTDAIRRDLGISAPGTVIFLAPRGPGTDDQVVVEADGLGGATTSIVEGNYPLDSVIKFEKTFPSEKDAQAAAEELSFQQIAPNQVLGAPAW
jgi:hypothetical protein